MPKAIVSSIRVTKVRGGGTTIRARGAAAQALFDAMTKGLDSKPEVAAAEAERRCLSCGAAESAQGELPCGH